jgi:hypothetical protein
LYGGWGRLVGLGLMRLRVVMLRVLLVLVLVLVEGQLLGGG